MNVVHRAICAVAWAPAPCTARSVQKSRRCIACAAAFRPPLSYEQLIEQAQEGTRRAIDAGEELIEIEFPPAGLAAVPGDGEGANEMTFNMDYLRSFVVMFNRRALTSASRTRLPLTAPTAMALASASSLCIQPKTPA